MPETFNFPYHVSEIKYPASSIPLQFGKGYEFASKPVAPDQIRFLCHFSTMKFFLNTDGSINRTIEPFLNLAKLQDFYEAHRLYEKFYYPSDIKGTVLVRFAQPLNFKMTPKGNGTCDPFTLELVMQP